MPLLNPSKDELILRELQEMDVLGPDMITQIMSDHEEFRLFDKLLSYRDLIPTEQWISYLCKHPEFSYYGLHKPSKTFLRGLNLSSIEKQTLLNFGALPYRLENDTLWMCGMQAPHELEQVCKDFFKNLSFNSLRYCALPLNLIDQAVKLL